MFPRIGGLYKKVAVLLKTLDDIPWDSVKTVFRLMTCFTHTQTGPYVSKDQPISRQEFFKCFGARQKIEEFDGIIQT